MDHKLLWFMCNTKPALILGSLPDSQINFTNCKQDSLRCSYYRPWQKAILYYKLTNVPVEDMAAILKPVMLLELYLHL
jgi:hypothetical protein